MTTKGQTSKTVKETLSDTTLASPDLLQVSLLAVRSNSHYAE